MYQDFQASFPELAESTDPKSVLKIDEEAMKSSAGKEKWRVFINKYENKGESLDADPGTVVPGGCVSILASTNRHCQGVDYNVG